MLTLLQQLQEWLLGFLLLCSHLKHVILLQTDKNQSQEAVNIGNLEALCPLLTVHGVYMVASEDFRICLPVLMWHRGPGEMQKLFSCCYSSQGQFNTSWIASLKLML